MERLTREQIEELREFDAPTICNAIEFFGLQPWTEGYVLPGLEQRTGGKKSMIGYAATAKIIGSKQAENPGIFMDYLEYVRESEDPTVIVMQDMDERKVATFWGDVNASTHMSLGAVGLVTDGAVRDLKEVDEMGFYFFSSCLAVSHGYAHIEEYDCPVNILGLDVMPGDLICADRHGVVKIPAEIAPRLAEACRRVGTAESYILKPCKEAINAGRKVSMSEIRQWRGMVNDKRKEAEMEYGRK